jgi:hypothetical protein
VATPGICNFKAVEQSVRIFHKKGPVKVPKDLIRMIFNRANNVAIFKSNQLLSSLISLNQALKILDQMIYQAIVNENLAVLDNKNLIQHKGPHKTLISIGHQVDCQPKGHELYSKVDDLILLKDPRYDIELCQIEGIQLRQNTDVGMTLSFDLRSVDEYLNPYGPLLVNLEVV